ncbi:DMT family transporter [Litorivicinus lipolyticus]|uniref:DMT family transporter n=1 Tax=Litorivicinus lipolyticus TaxID=418701 RepID=UPI003B5BCF4D
MTYLTAALWVVFAAALFGLQPIYGLMLKDSAIDVNGMMLIRFAVPTLAALVWVGLTRPSLQPWACAQHALMGVAFALTGIGYYQAGYQIGFSLAVLLFYSFPLIVTVYTALCLRATLRPVQIGSVVVATAGLVLAIDVGDVQASAIGIAWALLAAACYAFILTFKSHYAPPLAESASLLMLTGGATATVLAIGMSSGWTLPSTLYEWQWSLALALFAGLVPIALIMLASPVTGATDSATYCLIEPVVAIAVAVGFMGEPFSVRTLLGGTLTLIAVTVLVRTRHRARPVDQSALVQ